MTTPRKRRRAGSPFNHDPEAVTYAREKAGLTQGQLADLCGWSFQLQCDIEAVPARRNADDEKLTKIAQHTNCPKVFMERKREVSA